MDIVRQVYYFLLGWFICVHLLDALTEKKSWKEILLWGILYFGWFIL